MPPEHLRQLRVHSNDASVVSGVGERKHAGPPSRQPQQETYELPLLLAAVAAASLRLAGTPQQRKLYRLTAACGPTVTGHRRCAYLKDS
jgi:hypothetical protein